MKALGIIPARFASTRFPGKPLIDIDGKSMIQRVFEQASSCTSLTEVYVATDDERIYDHVIEFGGKVVMTSIDHQSGTDRCKEAIENISLNLNDNDVVINIQGDEPFLKPDQIELLIGCFGENSTTQIATLIKKIDKEEDLFNPNIVKAIVNKNLQAIYFSRQPIPYNRGLEENEWTSKHDYFKHIGIYAYRFDILNQITTLKPSALEQAENLEQLRWIEHNFSIQTRLTTTENIAIDTPNDLNKIGDKI